MLLSYGLTDVMSSDIQAPRSSRIYRLSLIVSKQPPIVWALHVDKVVVQADVYVWGLVSVS
jgi:hypothetical protein